MEDVTKNINIGKQLRIRLDSSPLFDERNNFFIDFKKFLIKETILVKSIALTAQWGDGKSFFINMLNTELEKGYNSVVFNAWKYDKYNNPLLALLAFIHDTSKIGKLFQEFEITNKEIKIGGNITLGIPFLSMGVSAESAMNNYLQQTLELNEIYQSLFKVFNELDFIFIDELDRCNPEFALSIIELFKHFSVDSKGKAKVIFSFDKEALTHIIKNRYGDVRIANIYIKKLIEAEFILPKITNKIALINDIVDKHLDEQKGKFKDSSSYIYHALKAIINDFDYSVREILDLISLMKNSKTINDYTFHTTKTLEEFDYFCFTLFIFFIALENKNYSNYLIFKKTYDRDIIINEINVNSEFRKLIERLINRIFQVKKTHTITPEEYDDIIFLIVKGCFSKLTREDLDAFTKNNDDIFNIPNPIIYNSWENQVELFRII